MVLWEAKGLFKRVQAKNSWKKYVTAFRIEIIRILMAADFVLQIGWVQTFFLWKYLILSQFLILKTPTEHPYYAISAEISFHSTSMSNITTKKALYEKR
jgi:hypothetical protein